LLEKLGFTLDLDLTVAFEVVRSSSGGRARGRDRAADDLLTARADRCDARASSVRDARRRATRSSL